MIRIEAAGARELVVRLEGAPAVVIGTLRAQLNKAAVRLYNLASQKVNNQLLQVRTAHLARALFWRVEPVTGGFLARIGVDTAKARYGRAHELGAVITPKRAKNLTIPVPGGLPGAHMPSAQESALTKSGVPRFTAREFISSDGRVAGFTSSFVNKNKTAIYGLRKAGDYAKIFLLRQQVALPQRSFLASTLDENRERLMGDLQASVEAAFREHMERG